MRKINWKEIIEELKLMTDKDLLFKYKDCLDTLKIKGIKSTYHLDKSGIYYNEIVKRKLYVLAFTMNNL